MGQYILRADASLEMGTGHVMRCLTLATALSAKGHDCHFICRDHKGHLAEMIKRCGFKLTLLTSIEISVNNTSALSHARWLGCTQEQDAKQVLSLIEGLGCAIDGLIVDHYALDAYWESQLRVRVAQLVVIDDLFDRHHDCDILINQNLGSSKAQYKTLVPSDCLILAGIAYAMLRPEFARLRPQSLLKKSHAHTKQLLITMGGVDPDNYTGNILKALECCDCSVFSKIVVVLGGTAPHIKSVEALAASLSVDVEIKVGVSNMAEIMSDADVAFGAAGSTSWERCCLGLPTLLFVIADNQVKLAELLARHNAAMRVDMESICDSVKRMLDDDGFYKETSEAAAALCDGMGAERVVASINGH